MKKNTHTHTHLKSTLKRKNKICRNALDFFDLVLPIFFYFYHFNFILFLEFFLESWKISKATPKHREQMCIYIYIQSQPSPHLLFTEKKNYY